jgi:hypothetical protein
MAFKGIDFGKLNEDAAARRAMTPEQRGQLEAREDFARSVGYVAKDVREREAMSKEARVVELAEHPASRFDINEGMLTTLYLVPRGEKPDFEKGGNISRAIFKGSEAERMARHASHDAPPLEQLLGRLDRGSIVTLLGEERSRRQKNDRTGTWSTIKEFHVAKIAEGELTKDQMIAHRRGDEAEKLADVAMAYDRAATPAEKEAIARAHLGHPASDRPKPMSKGPGVAEDDGVDAVLAQVASNARSGSGR